MKYYLNFSSWVSIMLLSSANPPPETVSYSTYVVSLRISNKKLRKAIVSLHVYQRDTFVTNIGNIFRRLKSGHAIRNMLLDGIPRHIIPV